MSERVRDLILRAIATGEADTPGELQRAIAGGVRHVRRVLAELVASGRVARTSRSRYARLSVVAEAASAGRHPDIHPDHADVRMESGGVGGAPERAPSQRTVLKGLNSGSSVDVVITVIPSSGRPHEHADVRMSWVGEAELDAAAAAQEIKIDERAVSYAVAHTRGPVVNPGGLAESIRKRYRARPEQHAAELALAIAEEAERKKLGDARQRIRDREDAARRDRERSRPSDPESLAGILGRSLRGERRG